MTDLLVVAHYLTWSHIIAACVLRRRTWTRPCRTKVGSIAKRTRKNGSVGYTAQIVRKRNGKRIFSESQTFLRRGAAVAWVRRREAELDEPGAIDRAINPPDDPILGVVIERNSAESLKVMGRTKAQVLRSIMGYDIADMRCSQIGSGAIVEFAKELLDGGRAPQTVANYLSHLGSIFAIARPAWNVSLDPQAMRDAITVCKRLGYTGKSRERTRRPTMDELDRIMTHFWERSLRVPDSSPMHKIIAYAIFSTRRQEEITRVTRHDLDRASRRQTVRDMKHPGQKVGNDTSCDLPDPCIAICDSMPAIEDRIFPFKPDAISAAFTRACKFLGIDDLHFHDLRHEGISRLFEMGWSIPRVADVSGHRSWQSLKRYTQLRHQGDRFDGWRWIPVVTSTGRAGPVGDGTSVVSVHPTGE